MVEHQGPARAARRGCAPAGFPRTHRFAQARSVFAVAAHRCTEVFDPPGCVTLWRLPEAIEEEFDARWEHWLDNASEWTPFFEKLETLSGTDLTAILRAFELVSDRDLEAYGKLRRSAEGRAVRSQASSRAPTTTSRSSLSASPAASPARSPCHTRGEAEA